MRETNVEICKQRKYRPHSSFTVTTPVVMAAAYWTNVYHGGDGPSGHRSGCVKTVDAATTPPPGRQAALVYLF